jgi:hypothetical protein
MKRSISCDASDFATHIGGEVRDFNPLDWIDKRDVNRSNARTPGHQCLPVLLEPCAKWRDQAKTRYDHATITVAFHVSSLLL